MKKLSEWLEYISSLYPQAIDLDLSRMWPIVNDLGVKNFSCPVITVGGTNGKGSCVRFLESIYHAAGYRVGAYTSPDLFRFNERIRLNTEEIDDHSLIAAFEHIEKIRNHQPLTFFEFSTLAALYWFSQQNLNVLILEVGLGGRLDSVNVVNTDVAVIATIGIDHIDRLGPDRESIGYEKAGIFRTNKPVVCGDPDPPHTVTDAAARLHCPFYGLGKNFSYEMQGNSWTWKNEQHQLSSLSIPQLPMQNAATSLMVVELLQNKLSVSRAAIDLGVQRATLPGRFEIIHTPRVCVFDVAHNPSAALWLAEQLRTRCSAKKTIAVVGMLKDKLIPETIEPLQPLIDEWFIAGLSGPRGHDGSQIIEHLRANAKKNWYNFASVAEALRAAFAAAEKNETRVVIFGSFHTVAEAKSYLSLNELS